MLSNVVTTLSPEVIANFRSSLYVKGRSIQTVKAYCSDLRVMLADLQAEQIQVEHFEEAAAGWLTKNRRIVAPKTTGRRLTSLRVFVKWAKWQPMLEDYGAPTPPKGTPHPLPEGIDGVFRMIVVSESYQEKALIALCGLCGLRIAEALGVKPSHIDIDSMDLTVRGKGDKTRIVPISPEAWEAMQEAVLRAYITGGDPEIVGFKDRHARAVVTRLGQRAGLVRRVASHDLRATFATAVYNKTLDQRVVQDLMGHASGNQTEIYIEVSINTKRRAVSGLT